MFVFSAVDDTIQLEAVTFTVFKATTARAQTDTISHFHIIYGGALVAECQLI